MKRFIALLLSLVMTLSLCAPAWAAGGTLSGKGTETEPYIINDAADLTAISDKYDTYAYYKVADGVNSLDLTGVGKIKLNGSFDGNGVTLNNLNTALFEYVGKTGEENAKEIKISNLTAYVNTTDGRALVRNIYNYGKTIFENVTMHGYIEGQYNMGSFYNYGTANFGSGDGADYTVSFVNAKSDVTLVCTTGNVMGGMLGHGYEGAGNVLSIDMDDASGYNGTMYTTTGANCYQVMAMCSHATYKLNGVETSRYENTYPSTKLTAAAPTAGDGGYYVAPVEGVDHYVVFINAQMTAYNDDGSKIANLAGMTWPLGNVTITEGFEGKVFDLITNAEIVNGVEHDFGYAMNDGVLTIYSGRNEDYVSGWVTLQVNQYNKDNELLATGSLKVHTFGEPTLSTVSFDANGGSGEMKNLDKANGVKFTLPECTFTAPEGKQFKGWATSKDATEMLGATCIVTGETTFYAVWEDITYTVTFNANGGIGTMAGDTVVTGTVYDLPENGFTAPAGKYFKGWATAANGAVIDAETYTVKADTVFYALWEDITYSVSFNANGGTGTMAGDTVVTGTAYELPECGFTAPAGKYFKGWATAANGAVIDAETYTVKADTVFYAVWDDVTYSVSFNANGGTGVLTQAPVPAGQFTLPTEHPFTREGYTFVGWATDKNATKVLGATYNVTGDVTFYAIWEEEECRGDSHVKVLVEYSGDKATKVYCDYCGMTFAFIQGTEDDAKDKFGEGNYVNAENDVWYTLKAQSSDVVVPPVEDEVVTVPEVEVVAPEVTVKIDTSDAMTPEQEEAVQKAADEVAEKLVVSDAVKVEEQKLADAAAEIAKDTADKVETIVTDEHVDALDKLIKNETVKEEDVVLAVQTYVDIQVSEIEVKTEDSDTTIKTVTLNITPMYQVVATTEKVLTDPNTKIDTDKDNGNAVKVGDPKPMTVETMEVTIPLPSVFAEKLVYILHEAAKGDVIYTATADADGNVTFTTKSGFSPFTFSMDEIAVGAEVEGGDSYADLQSAVNYAGKNAVITVKKAGQSAVVSGETTFTLQFVGEANKNNTKITAAAGYRVFEWGGKYIVSKVSAGGYAPSTTPEKVVTSADTFDAGIGLYVAMSVMAAAGSAVVLKKRED